ncbi:integrase_H2C2 domain-containing protein [Trichonephila clavipes]|uniref:Integrase_H2C2 domain-containing protein n=1 Tax=Trichonephila clavipes TaxID=2585209 RepID=A0A8X6RIL5_TRICX|nr:integrase_H2C2 domain-containing protein [Trichonephila clavipes]
MERTWLVLGVCSGCQLGSSFSFLHTGFGSMTNMVSLGDNFFFYCSLHGTFLFCICRNLRGQLNFLLIVDGLQSFDVLPSSTGNFLLIVDRLQTFDILPSSTGDSSTHRGWTADLLMCCPDGAPNFFRSIDASAIF